MSDRLKYPYVNLPQYFTALLKSNMQSTSPAFTQLGNTISQNRGFYSLVSRAFLDIDSKTNLKVIINSVGWVGFRDRMAAIFLEYQETGLFPNKVNLNLVEDIGEFESLLKPYSVEGFSRGFLLGFYLKMAGIKPSSIGANVISMLSTAKSKPIQIDWVLLTLNHYGHFLGQQNLHKLLKSGAAYTDLFRQISPEQRKLFTANMMAYGASIHEQDMFIDDKI